MTTSVHDLDLVEVDVLGLDRDALLAALREASERHWLVRVPLGYAVTRYEESRPSHKPVTTPLQPAS